MKEADWHITDIAELPGIVGEKIFSPDLALNLISFPPETFDKKDSFPHLMKA